MYILVVDDNPLMRELIDRFLTQIGYRVQVAASAAEARTIAEVQIPAMALVDLHLPDLDGASLLGELRRIPGCAELPAIGMSGSDEADLRRIGAQQLTIMLTKPIELDLLQSLVAQHIGSAENMRARHIP